MESVGSNSPSPTTPYDPAQHFTDRLIRALSHRLALLHRSDANFYILGATANVYTVTLSTTPTCTCPDRAVPCKHILFVLLRVLGLSFDDPCLRRRALRSCHVARALSMPTAPDVHAGARARERFHEVFAAGGCRELREERSGRRREEEEGAVCPVCLEEMVGGEELVSCGTCGNSLHGECLGRWKRSRGRRAASCVVCRARWRERREVERYVNLGAFVREEEDGWGLCAR